MTMPKILMLCDFFSDELDFQENLLSKYYRKLGCEVVIVTSTYTSVFDFYEDRYEPSIRSEFVDQYGSRVIRVPFGFNIKQKLKTFTGFFDVLNSFEPDVLFFHSIHLDMITSIKYLKNNRPRVIVDYHMDKQNSANSFLSRVVLHSIIRNLIRRIFLKYIDVEYAVAPSVIDFMGKRYAIQPECLPLLPLGSDVDLIDTLSKSNCRNRIIEQYGLDQECFVMVTGGKLNNLKRTHIAIRAAHKVCEMDNSFSINLLVVGEGDSKDSDYCESLKHLASIGNANIIFCGWQGKKDLYSHLLASDVAVFPRSQSILWQHAIASGLPLIVGTAVDESVDYLNGGDNMIIVNDTDDEHVFAQHILKLAQDEELRRSMGAGSKAVTKEMLDWNTLIRKVLK